MCCAPAFLSTVLQAEKQRWIYFFPPMNLLVRMKVRLLLQLLCAVEKCSRASASRAPNFEIHLAEAIAVRGDPRERDEPSLLLLDDGIREL